MLAAGVPTVSRSFHVLEPSARAFRERNCAQESSNIRQPITTDMNSCLTRAQRVPCLNIPIGQGRCTESGVVGSRIAEISRCLKQSWRVDTISTSRRNSLLLCGHVGRLRSPDTRRVFSSPAIKIDRSKREVPVTEDIDEDSEDVCHVGCVREISTKQELDHALEAAQRRNAVVVVDFFKTACGSCKYIEHGFAKLCRGESERQHPVIFLKHNVMNEYEEESDLAAEFRIKVVPLFYFYRDAVLVAKFPTRDKEKILEAINKFSSVTYEHVSTDDSIPKIPERNR